MFSINLKAVKRTVLAIAAIAALAGGLLPTCSYAGTLRKFEEGIAVDAIEGFAERAAIRAGAHHLEEAEAKKAAELAIRSRRAAESTKDGARIQQFKSAEHNLAEGRPYSPRSMLDVLRDRYGASNVTRQSMPEAGAKNVKLATQRHPKSGVTFDERGYPVFDDHAKFDTKLPHYNPSASRDDHMKAATSQLRGAIDRGEISPQGFTQQQLSDIQHGKSQIEGYSWHHHQDCGRMQLVKSVLHAMTGHVGGYADCQ